MTSHGPPGGLPGELSVCPRQGQPVHWGPKVTLLAVAKMKPAGRNSMTCPWAFRRARGQERRSRGRPLYSLRPEELRSRGSRLAPSFQSCTSNCRRRVWVPADALRTVISRCEGSGSGLRSGSATSRFPTFVPAPCVACALCRARDPADEGTSGFLPRKALACCPHASLPAPHAGPEPGPRRGPLSWPQRSSFEHTVGAQSRSGNLLEEFTSRVFAQWNQTCPASREKQGRVGLAEGSRRSCEEEEHTVEDSGIRLAPGLRELRKGVCFQNALCRDKVRADRGFCERQGVRFTVFSLVSGKVMVKRNV